MLAEAENNILIICCEMDSRFEIQSLYLPFVKHKNMSVLGNVWLLFITCFIFQMYKSHVNHNV